jgi:hypothetical protein
MAQSIPAVSIGNELPKPAVKWYHGKLGRELAEELLVKDGNFQ